MRTVEQILQEIKTVGDQMREHSSSRISMEWDRIDEALMSSRMATLEGCLQNLANLHKEQA